MKTNPQSACILTKCFHDKADSLLPPRITMLLSSQRQRWRFSERWWSSSSAGSRSWLTTTRWQVVQKKRQKTFVFPPADETGTKDTWEKSLWRGHEENLLRPFRSRTGIFLHENGLYNFLTLKPGHSGDRSNDRPDAELWREEHSGLQRGGGHQPGGSGTARE